MHVAYTDALDQDVGISGVAVPVFSVGTTAVFFVAVFVWVFAVAS